MGMRWFIGHEFLYKLPTMTSVIGTAEMRIIIAINNMNMQDVDSTSPADCFVRLKNCLAYLIKDQTFYRTTEYYELCHFPLLYFSSLTNVDVLIYLSISYRSSLF